MPGRTTRDEIRYSHANRNNNFGLSCSIARANRNSSRSFHSPVFIVRHPANPMISRRWSVRVCSRPPYPRKSPIGIARRCDNRPTAAAGAAVTSSGTNPSHGKVHNCTAAPSTLRDPRNLRTNASSAPVTVKCRIRSTRPISGKPRSCANSSSENTSRVATRHRLTIDRDQTDVTLRAAQTKIND